MLDREPFQSLSVNTFTAFDVETTGLDFEKDEIIEIGMVRIQSGQIAGRYQSLFKPSVPIPVPITKLTGIRNRDCENQPPLSEKLPEILNFFNGHWVVAHHADFDYGFLCHAVRLFFPDTALLSRSRVFDTLELSRIALPFLPSHKLESVVEALGCSFKPNHRALADAEAAAFLFQKLVPRVLELELETIQNINRILNGASDGLRLFFNDLEKLKIKEQPPRKRTVSDGPKNTIGRRTDAPKSDAVQHLPVQEITDFFAPDGPLSRGLSKYESRRPQQEMAEWTVRAFNEDAFLVAEAGTGVGKTLSYLVPLLHWLGRNPGRKAVVSTHTKTLQDQLFFKDIPLLEKTIPNPFSAVLLKGRSNYLCLARWHHLLQRLDERMNSDHRRKLLPLVHWVSQTSTGDIEENSGFSREYNEDIWMQLNCETRHCRNRECVFEPRCFLQNVRKAARSADVSVVNHSLLFSSLNSAHSILGDFEALVLDEAHQIEKTASQYLGISLGVKSFHEAAHWTYHAKPEEGGVLISMVHAMKSARISRTVRIQAGQAVQKQKSHVLEIHQAASDLFQALDRRFFQPNQEKPDRMKVRIRKEADLLGAVSNELIRLREILVRVKKDWAAFSEFFRREVFKEDSGELEWFREIESIGEKWNILRDYLEFFLHPDCENHAVWCEYSFTRNGREVTLHAVPVDIGSLLAGKLFPRIRRGVLTSATLVVGDGFDYFLKRWGMDRIESERILTRQFGSPFDYREQALFLIPTFLSNPKEGSFANELSSLIARLLISHPKGTLVLFTSHIMLREVYRSVQPVLEEKGIRMLGQGIDGNRAAILRMFRQDTGSVLFGTSSFWEGIDVPGEALEMLIITRIPFDVPTDPLVEARMERVQKQTGNAFFNYAVPEAIVRFRQGFGRLIRTGEDRGVVLLADHRAVQPAYGPLFLNSLPVEATLCGDEGALLSHLNDWFSS